MTSTTPPAKIAPARDAPLLGATVNPRLPLPDPDDEDRMIQLTFVVTVQGHPAGAAIPMVPAPPADGNWLTLTVASMSQAEASCRIDARCPLMAMAVSRAEPFGFAVARN
jgi:hypothetical protein